MNPMATIAIALGSFVLYLVAYHTYGRYLARKVFQLDPDRTVPAIEFEDGVDYVPSRRALVFGHHLTSIAGTGPIVGPAVAVVWGWVPAILWVLIGSIVMGAVHDFGALIISMRHKGQTIAELAKDVINPRVRILFMLVTLMGLWIVLAIFGLVIALVFKDYPSAVMPSILQVPIAIALGLWMRRGGNLIAGTMVAVVLMYASILIAANYEWAQWQFSAETTKYISANALWTLILLGYVFIASVLPVHWLLQPRDYINSWQLLIAMGLLLIGLVVSHPPIVATAINTSPAPSKPGEIVPSFMPFLFVTIACGAISGFHCLVASGCSSRQLKSEKDAQYVGYGAMLTEGFLATLVILACVAGIGLGTTNSEGIRLLGNEAWLHHYATWGGGQGLGDKLAPFIKGAANMIASTGLNIALATAIMGVFVASFAATTLDSATRLQRYIIAELAGGGTGRNRQGFGIPILTNRFAATGVAVITAAILALSDAFKIGADGQMVGLAGAGLGALILWPIFGATNQLLGGLALLVITVWLVKNKRPFWVSAVPMVFMLAMTGWALAELTLGFAQTSCKTHLFIISILMLIFEIWIIFEAAALLISSKRKTQPPASPG